MRPGDVLFDHLVGAGEDRLRHGEAKRLGGLQIGDDLCASAWAALMSI